MRNKQLILTIYIKSKSKPLCTIVVDDENILSNVYDDIIHNKLLLLDKILISADEFKYATLEYK